MAFDKNAVKVAIKYRIKMGRAVQGALEQETPKTLKQAGHYVFRVARAIVVQRGNPNTASAAGSPPFSHASKKRHNTGFKKTIVYAMDGKYKVVIGPQVVRNGLSELAKTHEFGGTRRVSSYVPPPKTKPNQNPNPKPRSAAQKAASRKYFERKRKEESVKRKKAPMVMKNFPARPYMRPALEFSLPRLSQFWANSVH